MDIPSWNRWDLHPSVVIGLALLGGLYVYLGGLRSARRHVASFVGALVVLFLALNGPLHDLSDSYLFSAHMVQHLLLTLAVPPLLLAGTPGWMLRPALRSPVVASIARAVTKPFACYVIFNVVIIAWHLPPLYNLAMANHNVHIGEHLMF